MPNRGLMLDFKTFKSPTELHDWANEHLQSTQIKSVFREPQMANGIYGT